MSIAAADTLLAVLIVASLPSVIPAAALMSVLVIVPSAIIPLVTVPLSALVITVPVAIGCGRAQALPFQILRTGLAPLVSSQASPLLLPVLPAGVALGAVVPTWIGPILTTAPALSLKNAPGLSV